MSRPGPLVTAYTLSLDAPESMRAAATSNADRPLLKIKLGGDGDVGRIRAARDGAPQAALVVDANEAWSRHDYDALIPVFAELGVSMIEQPAPAGDDDWLADVERPIPICADESCHDTATLGALVGKYDMINIKLDKTGGLTEALRLRSAARDAGLDIMVGCMVGTSLAMAPAFLVAQGASVVDLDGPLLLKEDRNPGIRYDGSRMVAVPAALWG
jgi:L-alanine-DL-glutamate epimerase-like enolase superfamily enzyme